ncbi:MAG: serine/threonine-protein kinase [Myxococcota bacterium]
MPHRAPGTRARARDTAGTARTGASAPNSTRSAPEPPRCGRERIGCGRGGTLTTFGPYAVESELGRGGAGVVYRARHAGSGAEVALKVLHTRGSASLDREIDVLAALSHPGVVRVLDHGEADGRRWVATELLTGRTLREVLGSRDRADTFSLDAPGGGDSPPAGALDSFDPDDLDPPSQPVDPLVRTALGQVVRTLAWLHGEGIVHRDVKPENLMLVGDRAVLLDFGMATPTGTRDAPESLPGGTPGYMAPEQARGEAVDSRADLYALGCMLVEALSGFLPIHPDDAVPDAMAPWIRPLLAERPDDRVLHVDALAGALGVPSFGPRPRPVLHRPAFVGRPEIVAWIEGAMRASQGSLLITGASGVGKTRAAMEVFAEGRRHGRGAFAGTRQGPLAPFAPVLRSAWALEDARAHGALAATARYLGIAPDLPEPPPLDAEAHRLRLLDGVFAALERLSARRPVVLVLDDLHEAHPLTVEAACGVARLVRAAQLRCVLVTTWNTDAGRPIPMLERTVMDRRVLGVLAPAALEQLATFAAPDAPGPVREASLRLARGNPLLCMEGLRQRQGGTLAETFEQRVIARVRVLDAPVRAWVNAAAIGADDVDVRALGEIAGLSGRALSVVLHEARHAGLVELHEGWASFPHRQVRRAVLAALPTGEPERLHTVVASLATGASRAVHLEQAGDVASARRAWLDELAGSAGHPLRRRRALERAEALWDGPIPPWLALERARAEKTSGALATAARYAQAALAGTVEERLDAQLLLAICLPTTDPEVPGLLESVLADAERAGLHGRWVHARVAQLRRARTTGAPIDTLLAGYAEVRARLGPDDHEGRVLETRERGTALVIHGRPEEGARALEEALAGLDEHEVPDRCALLGNLGAARWQAFDVSGAIDATMQNARVAARHGVLPSLRSALTNLGIALAGLGATDVALGLVGGAIELALRTGHTEGIAGSAIRAVEVLMVCGEFTRGGRVLDRIVPWCEALGPPLMLYEAAHRMARCRIVSGDLSGAHSILVGIPDGYRDDAAEIRGVIACLRGESVALPQSTDACVVLGLASSDPVHHAHVRDAMAEMFGRLPMAINRRWAVQFGATGLPDPIQPPPIPPEIDALRRPFEPTLHAALAALAEDLDRARQNGRTPGP